MNNKNTLKIYFFIYFLDSIFSNCLLAGMTFIIFFSEWHRQRGFFWHSKKERLKKFFCSSFIFLFHYLAFFASTVVPLDDDDDSGRGRM